MEFRRLVSSGLPFFLIYINLTHISYTDNTALISQLEEAKLNSEFTLTRVMNWLDLNLLTLNVSKRNYITFAANRTPPSSFSFCAYFCPIFALFPIDSCSCCMQLIVNTLVFSLTINCLGNAKVNRPRRELDN